MNSVCKDVRDDVVIDEPIDIDGALATEIPEAPRVP